MIRGLFINQKKAQCSIYEVGILIKNCLINNDKYTLDYIETDATLTGVNTVDYDFYVINWHMMTLAIPAQLVQEIQGFKIAIILEVGVTKYIHPPEEFDAYMVIDPTKQKTDAYYPFPRPVPPVKDLRPILDTNKLVLGSFGFVGYDVLNEKRFEEIILYANASKRDSIVRFNFPSATFIEKTREVEAAYDRYLKMAAKSYVDVRITHDYFDNEELTRWLSEHTMNCFPYYRTRPGLAAVTDQAVAAGRALAITTCETFRHLHTYIEPYNLLNFLRLTNDTLRGVSKLQMYWHPSNFTNKFIELLTEQGVL